MDQSVLDEIGRTRSLTVSQLRARYRELLGEEPRSSNRDLLYRRIAWQLQANAEGGLRQHARNRIAEIAEDAECTFFREPPVVKGSVTTGVQPPHRNPSQSVQRILPVGTLLRRIVGDRRVVVTVVADGFEYQSRKYRSLSAIAREITGTRWNGPRFFGIGGPACFGGETRHDH